MESTNPNANFQPQIVQYKPAERSMLRNVPPFVRPSSNSFAFVRTNSSTNLNFASSAPTAPTPAAPFPHGDPCFVAAGPPAPPPPRRRQSSIMLRRRGTRGGLVGTSDAEGSTPVDLPGGVDTEAGDHKVKRGGDAGEDGCRECEPEQ